jgi:hypothetical protein
MLGFALLYPVLTKTHKLKAVMQAIELQANIDEKHQIHLKVPEDWPCQNVKVIVLLEAVESVVKRKRIFGQFRGQIKIAEDFDAELSDEFWLGNNA